MKYSKTTFGFYDPNFNSYIPADAVDVPYATYQALLAGQSAGQVIGPDANGNPVLSAPVITLAGAQSAACIAIDAQAGATRLKYITDVPGQADTYTRKAADAAAYKAAAYPFASIASYPWTQAEAQAINGVGFTAAQAQAAADGILATQAAWDAKGAAIEQARRAGKIAAGAAGTVAAVQTAQAAAIAALQAL